MGSSHLTQFKSFAWLLVMLCGIWVNHAVSQSSPVGTVLTASGSVTAVSAEGEARSLKRRDAVFPGDTLSTQASARVRFKLLDDSTYVLQENSVFTIEEYNYNGTQDGSEVADFYFSEGVMEFVSGYIGKEDSAKFRIDTEFAAIGLRGSGGIIRTDSGSTRVFVTLGELTARSRGGDLFVLNNGQTTVIDQTGRSRSERGNGTGAKQTMSTDGNDMGTDSRGSDGGTETDAEDSADTTDASVSAAEIYAELLPDSVEPTQDDLQQALSDAIEANPVLYAELITVAIDMGLEPPNAALAATEALGGASVSDKVITEIFFVATEGLTETAEVEAAILSADINAALVATPTDANPVNVGSDRLGATSVPSNTAVASPDSASPSL